MTWNLLDENALFDIRPSWGADFNSILGERLLSVERQSTVRDRYTVQKRPQLPYLASFGGKASTSWA